MVMSLDYPWMVYKEYIIDILNCVLYHFGVIMWVSEMKIEQLNGLI